jgi:hypothetical protein
VKGQRVAGLWLGMAVSSQEGDRDAASSAAILLVYYPHERDPVRWAPHSPVRGVLLVLELLNLVTSLPNIMTKCD